MSESALMFHGFPVTLNQRVQGSNPCAIDLDEERRGSGAHQARRLSPDSSAAIRKTLTVVIFQSRPTRGGFIHVPCTPAYVAKQSYPYHEYPSMHLDLMVDAVKTAIETTLCRDTDIEAPPRGY